MGLSMTPRCVPRAMPVMTHRRGVVVVPPGVGRRVGELEAGVVGVVAEQLGPVDQQPVDHLVVVGGEPAPLEQAVAGPAADPVEPTR